MIELTEDLQLQMMNHAASCVPREACGLLIEKEGQVVLYPCKNVAPPPMKNKEAESFIIDPIDAIMAEDAGKLVRYFHSHVGRPPNPTPADRKMCEQTKLPWVIINHPTGRVVQFEPCGYEVPLYEREWVHGVLDCYTFVQDYFSRVLGIALNDYPREPEWWNQKTETGEHKFNLYRDNFENENFVMIAGDVTRLTKFKLHDLILMQLGEDASVDNHAAVMVEDNIIGHHPRFHLSRKDVYGGYWLKHSTAVLRHKTLL